MEESEKVVKLVSAVLSAIESIGVSGTIEGLEKLSCMDEKKKKFVNLIIDCSAKEFGFTKNQMFEKSSNSKIKLELSNAISIASFLLYNEEGDSRPSTRTLPL